MEGAQAQHEQVSGVEKTIEIRGLSKTYRTGFWMRPIMALKPLTLDVYAGEIFGFVGPNGAGKTTTIKTLCGLQLPTEGSANILGIPCTDPNSRRQLGFMPERPYFYVHLTARELLNFYGQLFELPDQVRKRRIGELLERVGLTAFADVPLGGYSKGMLQRAGLCQTLMHDPKLIILDEPMSGLDPVGRALVRDLILEEKARGCTVFFSSHILSDVQSLCDRVSILVKGELRGVGTVDELIGDSVRHVDAIFGGLEEDPALEGSLLHREGRRWRYRLAPDKVDAAIAAVRRAGGTVIEIHPVRQDLEQVLVDQIQHREAT